MNKTAQTGFAHQLLLLLILVAAVIGVSGWYVMQQQNKANQEPISAEQASQIKADLQTELNDLNSATVDNDLDPTQLDSDLESLL